MADWRTSIEAEINALYVKAQRAYDGQNYDEAMSFMGQIVGIAKYGAYIGDGWTKIPALMLVEAFLEYVKNEPLIDVNSFVQSMIDEIKAIKV